MQHRFRRPTAEQLYRATPNLEVKSAGLAPDARTVLTADLLAWADIVFVFERRQRNLIRKRFPELYARKKIECLYVPDEYDYLSPELVRLLQQKLQSYLGPARAADSSLLDPA